MAKINKEEYEDKYYIKKVKKDLKEAILGIEVTQFDGQRADLEELVNPKQLEKIISDWMPEVLSQKWIDENEEQEEMYGTYGVPVRKLQNLLVPKQEKAKISKEDAKNIERYKSMGWTLSHLVDDTSENANHDELLARAWLDGYTVEEKQKYYVDLDTAAYVAKWDGNNEVDIYTDSVSGNDEYEIYLTEEEIKGFDERFWAFVVKVEELEE